MRRVPLFLGCMLAVTPPLAARNFDETRDDLLEYRQMLVTIRDRIQAMMDRGGTADEIVAAHPTHGYAEPGPGTGRWIRAAVDDLSR
jgi:hypothetical protein